MNKAVGAVILAVVLLLGFGWFTTRPKGSDMDQINSGLDRSISDGKKGDPNGAMNLLASHFTFNGEEQKSADIARLIKKYKPDLTVDERSVVVEGDKARLQGTAHLSAQVGPTSASFTITNVTFFLEKQTVKSWLIFPTSQWVVTDASAPAEDVAKAFDSFGGGF